MAAWRDLLAARPGARWALFVEDTFDFAAALFGAWHAGKTVIVPGDMQDDTVARLRGVGRRLPGRPARARSRVPRRARRAARRSRRWIREATQLVVYTSGTNGEPLAIPKRLAQLDAEVHALEARFGALCDTGLAPVNLAPETRGRGRRGAGLRRRRRAPSRRWSGPPSRTSTSTACCFACCGRSPRAGRSRPSAWCSTRRSRSASTAPRCWWPAPRTCAGCPTRSTGRPRAPALRGVFSSGGPLPPEAADSALALLGVAPVEVYGSSETGGVAWRQRARHGDTWQPLPGIEFRIDDGEL